MVERPRLGRAVPQAPQLVPPDRGARPPDQVARAALAEAVRATPEIPKNGVVMVAAE